MGSSKLSGKSRCGISYSDIEKSPNEFRDLVSDPRFVCRKCRRVAGKKKLLCRPAKLKSLGKGDPGKKLKDSPDKAA